VVVAGILVVGALGVFGLSRIGSGDSDSVVTSAESASFSWWTGLRDSDREQICETALTDGPEVASDRVLGDSVDVPRDWIMLRIIQGCLELDGGSAGVTTPPDDQTTAETTLPPETVPDTEPPVVPPGVASPEFWIEGVEMLQPPCDGGWITIVMSAAENQIIRGLYNFPGGGYLRTDITCASLNPRVPSGRYAGDPLYLVFFGPFYDRFEAQQQCLALGIRKKSSCFVAPLTNDPADRSRRYGPLDQ
jgi:hypothetical protein